MRAVPVSQLSPGMVVAERIFAPGDDSPIPLLAPGVVITEALRKRLGRTEVRSIVVDDRYSDGIVAAAAISEDARQEAIVSLRGAFANVSTADGAIAALTPHHVKEISTAVGAILAELTWRKNLMTGLSDLDRFGGDRIHRAVNVCVVGLTIGRRYLERWGWRDYRQQLRRDQFDERMHRFGLGLVLADTGMLTVPQHLWDADPATLDAEDRRLLEQHPSEGIALLRDGGADLSALTTVTILQHHERADGSGYPRGMKDEDQHDHGLIGAVADAYVGQTDAGAVDGSRDGSKAPPKVDPHVAYQRILDGRGREYDERVVDAFRDTVSPWGPGATVRLSDGRWALVVDHTDDPLRPHVRVTHRADGDPLSIFEQLDLTSGDLTIGTAEAGLPGDGA